MIDDDDDDEDFGLMVHEMPEGLPPQIETVEDLLEVLKELEPGKLVFLLQPELPDFGDEDPPEEYLFCKIMRSDPDPDGPPPFYIVGLKEDQDIIEATARKVIRDALGGKITGGGYIQ